MHKFFGIIPARSGSSRIKGKNMQLLGDKPLIQHTLEAVLSSREIDYSIVTSDDTEIIALAQKIGVDAPFVRPIALARDNSLAVDFVKHALE